MLVERLSQDLDDLFSLIEVSTAEKVDHDTVSAEDALAECLWLASGIQDLDLLVWRWDDICILLNHGSRELMRFLAGPQARMVVAHLFEKSVPQQAVAAGYKNALAFFGLGQSGHNF